MMWGYHVQSYEFHQWCHSSFGSAWQMVSNERPIAGTPKALGLHLEALPTTRRSSNSGSQPRCDMIWPLECCGLVRLVLLGGIGWISVMLLSYGLQLSPCMLLEHVGTCCLTVFYLSQQHLVKFKIWTESSSFLGESPPPLLSMMLKRTSNKPTPSAMAWSIFISSKLLHVQIFDNSGVTM